MARIVSRSAALNSRVCSCFVIVWDALLPTEVVSCLHPVRFYQPPDRPAFACVFARPLPADAPVALYAGIVCRDDKAEQCFSGMYTWDLDNEGTRCVINAGQQGGLARFVNADVYRMGGRSTVNCAATSALDEDLLMPAVALHTTCAVECGSECICNYGDRYWGLMKQHLRDVWRQYVDMARWLHRVMVEYLVASGLSPNRLPVPRTASRDEHYHWAPDEVQYPLRPDTAAAAAGQAHDERPHSKNGAPSKNGAGRRPVKRAAAG